MQNKFVSNYSLSAMFKFLHFQLKLQGTIQNHLELTQVPGQGYLLTVQIFYLVNHGEKATSHAINQQKFCTHDLIDANELRFPTPQEISHKEMKKVSFNNHPMSLCIQEKLPFQVSCWRQVRIADIKLFAFLYTSKIGRKKKRTSSL